MGKYLFKRILYSIFSVVCVMIVMIFLLFTLKDKEVIFQGDPYINKKKGNELTYYKNLKWEKYGYIDLVDFDEYIERKYAEILDNEQFEIAMTVPETSKDDTDDNKKYIEEFTKYYESKGYKVTRLESQYSKGEVKSGYTPYLYATKNNNTFFRLWEFFKNMFSVETVNDVDNYCKENELAPKRGYYLINEGNGWEEFVNYWGASTYKLSYDREYSTETERYYSIPIGVFEKDLNSEGKYEWSVVYYDSDKNIQKLIDNVSVNEIGEYKLSIIITKDANGVDTYESLSKKTSATPYTLKEKGTKFAIENKGIKIVWDSYSNMPALVGNGTSHKYLVYFDNNFPFVHQNIIHFSLGYSNDENAVLSKLFDRTGEINAFEQEYPAKVGTGEKETTANDFHTAQFSYSKALTQAEYDLFGSRYTFCEQHKSSVSRLTYSFTIGIVATIFSYILGIPLGILMARKKDKLADKIGMGYIIFIIAVPSLAYIYMITAIGSQSFLHLPNNFTDPAYKGAASIMLYILPVISLSMPGIAGEMKWVRRYMIDQENSDYVKFARSQGLSESEIFSKHISKNAIIPIVHGIPGAIIGCLSGAFITEKVYAIPGTGGLLVNAINGTDNGLILGLTFLFSVLSIISLILGDILLTIIDPRISFTSGGRK